MVDSIFYSAAQWIIACNATLIKSRCKKESSKYNRYNLSILLNHTQLLFAKSFLRYRSCAYSVDRHRVTQRGFLRNTLLYSDFFNGVIIFYCNDIITNIEKPCCETLLRNLYRNPVQKLCCQRDILLNPALSSPSRPA